MTTHMNGLPPMKSLLKDITVIRAMLRTDQMKTCKDAPQNKKISSAEDSTATMPMLAIQKQQLCKAAAIPSSRRKLHITTNEKGILKPVDRGTLDDHLFVRLSNKYLQATAPFFKCPLYHFYSKNHSFCPAI